MGALIALLLGVALARERKRAKIRERKVAELRAAMTKAEARPERAVNAEPFARAEPALRLVERALGPDGKAAIRVRLAAAIDGEPSPCGPHGRRLSDADALAPGAHHAALLLSSWEAFSGRATSTCPAGGWRSTGGSA